ncbi:centrosomin isoform X3 [Tribolium castaneum]|uniref:Centrosomin n=1 Tax=Tribolium castaneum TaxID=7070 RepID=D6WDS7_TRICA|nr:PREDICTED: centrosomin isoform X1 [Tribolium castaneum]EFA01271.1 centrosomin [Tribolium castaneum]|eukprot:XP_008191148.1 PREDICTED: centrosomin isoform X1 [Tribolium castaneum]
MAKEYIKAVIENTIMEEKCELEASESCDDVETEGASESNSMGLRSPGGPLRGRSVKEFEEQLSNLKKENFNLKLRIYFLEERMGVNFNLDKENVVKKNVELMVEVESLRKEVQEKHDLLCQAVKAMELEDEEHKKLVTEKEEMLTECQQEIEDLKTQLLDAKAESEILSARTQSGASDHYASQAFSLPDTPSALKELQDKIKSLEEELQNEKGNSAAIQIILDQNDTKIKSLSSQLDEATKKLEYRVHELEDMSFQLEEARAKCQGLHKKLEEKSQIVSELSSENDEFRKRQNLFSADLEKERKRYEKLRASSEQKIADLQSKLEASLAELKKSQDLVVSKSPGRRLGYTDADSFSVQKPATSPGSPSKDTNLLPTLPSPVVTPTSSPSPSVSFPFDHNLDLKQIIEQLKTERDAQHQKIVKLKAEQMKACKIIKSMIDSKNKTDSEITTLKQQNEELARELEEVAAKGDRRQPESLSNENSMDEQSGELIEHYKALTDELDEKNRILTATLKEKDNQMKKLQQQYEDIVKKIKEKEEHIVDLEFDLLTVSQEKLKEKEEEIERLNGIIVQRNSDLQGLVNKELWEKNREIEKLQKKQASEIEKLRNDLTTKEKQLSLIKEKISELGIEIDIQNGGISVENNLQNELEKSEKLRLEANEVCAVLSRRLEELAVFLDSLLKQKSVLGFLGNKENKRIRHIIDQSLDLSRTFTMSMIINPDKSLLQLTNISSLLNDTNQSEASLLPANMSLTYKSHLYKKDEEDNAQIIQTLRQQIINLKYELQLRDVELNKMSVCDNFTEISSEKDDEGLNKSNLNTTSTTLKYKSENQSESEAWSEPDRSVSRARIGLMDGSLKSNSSKKSANTSTDSTEDEEDRSSRASKKSVLNESRTTILELHRQVCELSQKLNEKESAYCDVLKNNSKLKQELDNLEIKLNDTELKLAQTLQDKIECDRKVQALEEEFRNMNEKDKKLEDKINEIELEKVEALKVAKVAEEAFEVAKNEINTLEAKLREKQDEMNELEEELRNEYQNQLKEKVKVLEEESLKKINEMQSGAEQEIKNLRNTIQQLQVEYQLNYVKKCEVEEALEEIERLKSEVDSLEERLEEMTGVEESTNKRFSDYEERINGLRSDLDNATLQYSEAVLDKTKIANEKALLEQELNRSVLKEIDTKKRLDEVENELQELRQAHQRQVSLLQVQKSKLEVRVSELESSNAELHNRLVKIQAGCGDNVASLSGSPNFVNQIVSFRRQHSDNSGYLSEEQFVMDDGRGTRSFSRLVSNQNFEIERHEANSSPDLGIESDHGRFSSLETHLNVQRPLLQTLELTESMNNLLDVESNHDQDDNCDNVHCCQKTLEMAHENSDLKRKLLRTRRALEETVTQLTLANQRKKQVEKTICKQIHKTSQVLRKAKANLDSGSETDAYKK